MSNNRQDELSFQMRIPASKCFMKNVLLTIDGIGDHFCFTESSCDRIKKALELVLDKSIDEFYKVEAGLFDLRFSIYKNKLLVFVEDYLLNSCSGSDSIEANSDNVKNIISCVKELTDGMSFSPKKGCNSCYSLSFNISFIDDNV